MKKEILAMMLGVFIGNSDYTNKPKSRIHRPRTDVEEDVYVLEANNEWFKRGMSRRDDEIRNYITFTLRTITQEDYEKLSPEYQGVLDESRALVGDVLGQGIDPEIVKTFRAIPRNRRHFVRDVMHEASKGQPVNVNDISHAMTSNSMAYGNGTFYLEEFLS